MYCGEAEKAEEQQPTCHTWLCDANQTSQRAERERHVVSSDIRGCCGEQAPEHVGPVFLWVVFVGLLE